MELTVEQIGLRYLDAAKKADSLIKECTRQLKEATRNNDFKRCMHLKRERLVLYSEKRDLLDIGYKLIHYYERKN